MRRDRLFELIATFFYVGRAPLLPGTFASLAALIIYVLTIRASEPLYYGVTIALVVIGFYAAGVQEKTLGRKDPPQIVIDEACGMLLTFVFLPFSIRTAALGFVIFRLLDIVKIPPIRTLQKLPSCWGIMLDDIAAAAIANAALRLMLWLSA